MSRVEVQVLPPLLLTALLQYLESGRASRSVWLLVWRSERLLALLRTSPSKRRTLRPPQKKRETSCTSFLILLLRRAQSILGTGNKTRSHCWRVILCEIVSLVQFISGKNPRESLLDAAFGLERPVGLRCSPLKLLWLDCGYKTVQANYYRC